MTVLINASNTSGLTITSDTSGNVAIQSNGSNVISTAGSNVTIAGTLTATGGVTSGANVAPTVSAYQSSAAQAITSGVATKITFDVTEWNVGSNYNVSSSTFTATVAGYYNVVAAVASQNVTGGSSELALWKNGSLYKLGSSLTASAYFRTQASWMVYLNGTTDYIQVYWTQNNGSSRNTVNAATDTYFQVCYDRSA